MYESEFSDGERLTDDVRDQCRDAALATSAMLTRFCPVFHFHPAERCGPVSVEAYQCEDGDWAPDTAMVPPGGGDPATYPLYTNARTIMLDGTEYFDLLYMVLYPYNFGPKLLGVGRRLGDHTADLEHVRILVDPVSDRMDRVYFGAHSGGVWKRIDECAVTGDTLDVFVAEGTHANYHSPGTQWRVPPVLRDVTSRTGFTWTPAEAALLPAPDMPARIADKVMDFKNQRWWDDVPPARAPRFFCL
jgi:hypothetical protein